MLLRSSDWGRTSRCRVDAGALAGLGVGRNIFGFPTCSQGALGRFTIFAMESTLYYSLIIIQLPGCRSATEEMAKKV